MPEKKIQETGTNVKFEAPSERISFFRKNQFWKRTLTNNDFLALYKRMGIANRVINKITNDMFDENF